MPLNAFVPLNIAIASATTGEWKSHTNADTHVCLKKAYTISYAFFKTQSHRQAGLVVSANTSLLIRTVNVRQKIHLCESIVYKSVGFIYVLFVIVVLFVPF